MKNTFENFFSFLGSDCLGKSIKLINDCEEKWKKLLLCTPNKFGKNYYKRRWKAITLITVFPLFYLYHFSTRSDLGRRCSKLLSVEKSMQMKINSFRFAMQISSFCVWKGNSRFSLLVRIFWQLYTKIDNFFLEKFSNVTVCLVSFWAMKFLGDI